MYKVYKLFNNDNKTYDTFRKELIGGIRSRDDFNGAPPDDGGHGPGGRRPGDGPGGHGPGGPGTPPSGPGSSSGDSDEDSDGLPGIFGATFAPPPAPPAAPKAKTTSDDIVITTGDDAPPAAPKSEKSGKKGFVDEEDPFVKESRYVKRTPD